MIRYVAIGAVVGFLVAYLALSSMREDPAPAPVVVPTQEPAPVRPKLQDLQKLKALPLNAEPPGQVEPAAGG